MADNPFAKFAASGGDGNPFAQFATPPDQGGKSGIDFSAPKDVVRAELAKLPPEQRKTAMQEWADSFVASERKGGGFMQGAADVARNVARGTPVGSWLDEANAAISSGVNKLTGGTAGAPYDEAVAYQRATDRAIDKGSTKLGTLPLIGDVSAAGVQKLAGGLLSAPVTPVARVMQGATMLPRIANSAATGILAGAGYGAGEGEDWKEGATNAAIGAGIGAGVGAAAPVVAQGIGNAGGFIADQFRRTPGALRNYDRTAVRNVSQGMTDDLLDAPRYQQETQALGREGMLADMGPSLQLQAGRLANMPGESRRIVTERMEGRRQSTPQRPGAADRIRADVDQALGPPANVQASIDATRQQANQAARPLYEQFERIVIDPAVYPQMQPLLRRAESAGLVQDARRALERRGYDPDTVLNTGIFWDQMKRSAQGIEGQAIRSGNRELARDYGNLRRELVDTIDDIVTPTGNRADGVYNQARRAAGEGLQFEEAAQMGQGAFSKGRSPEQVAAEMQGMAPAQLQAYEIGARDQVRTTMGNASTAFGPNGDTAARRQLQSEFARDKLNMIARPGGADRLTRRLDAETRFAETEAEALRNSATSRRESVKEMYPAPDGGREVARGLRGGSLTGYAAEGAYRIANMLSGGAVGEARATRARDAALLLTAQGVPRDVLVNALMQYQRQRGATQATRNAIGGVVQTLMEGSRNQAIAGRQQESAQ